MLLLSSIVCPMAMLSPSSHPELMFRGDPAHHGTILSAREGGYGGILWRVQTGGVVRSSPAELNGRIYFGGSDGTFYVLDGKTGATVWTRRIGSASPCSPALVGRLVIFTTLDGRVVAHDRLTGRSVWRYRFSRDLPLAWSGSSGDLYTSSPTPVGSRVYVGGGNGDVVALSLATGRRIWRFHTGGRVRATAALAGGTLYVGSFDGYMYALRANDGKLLWRARTLGANLDSGKYGYDRRSIQSSAAVAKGIVVFGSRDGAVYGLGARDGKRLWRLPDNVFWFNSSPAVYGDVAYIGSSDGHIIEAIDIVKGKVLWTFPTVLTWVSPCVSGRHLYSADQGGSVYCIDRVTGKKQWSTMLPAGIYSSPSVAGDHLVVGCDDGALYSLRIDAPNSLRKAVFFDDRLQSEVTVAAPRLRDDLLARGYESLDAKSLAIFLKDRVQDHQRSVVVFAMDTVPTTVSVKDFRAYLDAGGKVIWNGLPPFMFPSGSTKNRTMKDIDRAESGRVLGVSFKSAIFDQYSAMRTRAGEKLGLPPFWRSSFGADRGTVTVPFAVDEYGGAQAWLKSYGGTPGTGFVRLFTVPLEGFFSCVLIAAEYFPGK